MAAQSVVLDNAFLSVSGTDISAQVQQITFTADANMLDETAMGEDTTVNLAGRKSWSISIDQFNDLTDSGVDELIFSLWGAAAFAIIIRPDAGVKSATNPEYTGNAVLESFDILSATVSDVGVRPVSFQSAGALTRTE